VPAVGLWQGGRTAHTSHDASKGGYAYGGPQAQVDYFISYTSADPAWADWIAWQLKEAGSSVVFAGRDMVTGLEHPALICIAPCRHESTHHCLSSWSWDATCAFWTPERERGRP
jgi:hypothetical protein